MNPAMIGTAGGSQPFSILQPYLCVTFLIALNGVFPSRNEETRAEPATAPL
jgi:microcystin-dependent protein